MAGGASKRGESEGYKDAASRPSETGDKVNSASARIVQDDLKDFQGRKQSSLDSASRAEPKEICFDQPVFPSKEELKPVSAQPPKDLLEQFASGPKYINFNALPLQIDGV